jgi:hypothetical protein
VGNNDDGIIKSCAVSEESKSGNGQKRRIERKMEEREGENRSDL